MKILAFIVTLACCGLMFYVKREWKAAMLVMGAMTLTLVEIPGIPLHKANYLLQASLSGIFFNHRKFRESLNGEMVYCNKH